MLIGRSRNIHSCWTYRTPKDLADRMSARRRQANADDGYERETFTLPRELARERARGT